MVASSPVDYQIFRDFLEDACGILLGENKQYLVSSRLSKLMAEHNIDSLNELVKRISQVSNRRLKEAVVDAMTTNETLWFRDTHPFEIFKSTLLPEFQAGKNTNMRVWCAACSSGQEPYSLTMLIEEYRTANMGSLKKPVEIVATDLSASMLEQCKLGEYDSLSLGRGLSQDRLKRFFDKGDNGTWRVKPELRKPIRFQTRNLMDSFSTMGKFDVVFCRNVLIYFSAELKLDILRRIHASLRPGGYLILGASEGLSGVKEYYEMVQCHPGIIYRAI